MGAEHTHALPRHHARGAAIRQSTNLKHAVGYTATYPCSGGIGPVGCVFPSLRAGSVHNFQRPRELRWEEGGTLEHLDGRVSLLDYWSSPFADCYGYRDLYIMVMCCILLF